MTFSIIIVCLNPGAKIKETVDSVISQDYGDFEIIIKDGGSEDGSVDDYKAGFDPRIKFIYTKDSGIYDAMNQAVTYTTGDYVLFLNSGDRFYDATVLSKAARALPEPAEHTIAYGDAFFEKNRSLVHPASTLTKGNLYGNLPCHQSIFYSRDVLEARNFDTGLKIRADYEHLLYNFFKTDTEFVYLGFTVCTYEGGGVSESSANRERDTKERREAISRYYSKADIAKNNAVRLFTLSRVRKALNENPATSAAYQKFRNLFVK
ncbi:MAG: glycosyltransferase [Lachnospiraceae bacterium]|nr:glycosyltransferase [Lachnospiraceae bacterium]